MQPEVDEPQVSAAAKHCGWCKDQLCYVGKLDEVPTQLHCGHAYCASCYALYNQVGCYACKRGVPLTAPLPEGAECGPCPHCLCEFDGGQHLPKLLGCAHFFCASCVDTPNPRCFKCDRITVSMSASQLLTAYRIDPSRLQQRKRRSGEPDSLNKRTAPIDDNDSDRLYRQLTCKHHYVHGTHPAINGQPAVNYAQCSQCKLIDPTSVHEKSSVAAFTSSKQTEEQADAEAQLILQMPALLDKFKITTLKLSEIANKVRETQAERGRANITKGRAAMHRKVDQCFDRMVQKLDTAVAQCKQDLDEQCKPRDAIIAAHYSAMSDAQSKETCAAVCRDTIVKLGWHYEEPKILVPSRAPYLVRRIADIDDGLDRLLDSPSALASQRLPADYALKEIDNKNPIL